MSGRRQGSGVVGPLLAQLGVLAIFGLLLAATLLDDELAQARSGAVQGEVTRVALEDAWLTLDRVEQALQGVAAESDLPSAVADLAERNRELRLRNLRLIGQLANLERRAGMIGKPPCWVTPDGRPEYTYRITITDTDLMVEPIWRRQRAEEMERIGVSTDRETLVLDAEGFSQAMYPFLAWGSEADPECRFFVQVVDATGPFKGSWQTGLELVEGYFYKYWVK